MPTSAPIEQVQFGLKNFHYAIWDEVNKTAGAWKHIPGSTQLTTSAQTSQNVFHADNKAFYIINSDEGETGSIQNAYFTDEFYMDVFGAFKDPVTKHIVFPMDVQPKTCIIGYEVDGSHQKQRGMRFGVKFSRPNEEHNTTADTTDPDVTTLEYTATGLEFEFTDSSVTPATTEKHQILKTHVGSVDEPTAFNTFFDAVAIPGASV